MEKGTKKEIWLVSFLVGIGLIGFVLLGYGFSYFLALLGIGGRPSNFNLLCIEQIVYSLGCVMLPFILLSKPIRTIQGRDVSYLRLNRPKSGNYLGMSLAIGFTALVVFNYLSALFTTIMARQGVTFDSASSFGLPPNAGGYFWLVLCDVVVPALAEEFVCRGVILQAFRKYGDPLAIVVSGVIFGLMHGNMSQAPFAIALGMVIARLVILTDSLWTGIAIHMLNNAYALVVLILNETATQMQTTMAIIIMDTVGIMAGLIALLWLTAYFHEFGRHKLFRPGGNYPQARTEYRRQAELYTILAPTMLFALIYFLRELIKTIHVGGG